MRRHSPAALDAHLIRTCLIASLLSHRHHQINAHSVLRAGAGTCVRGRPAQRASGAQSIRILCECAPLACVGVGEGYHCCAPVGRLLGAVDSRLEARTLRRKSRRTNTLASAVAAGAVYNKNKAAVATHTACRILSARRRPTP